METATVLYIGTCSVWSRPFSSAFASAPKNLRPDHLRDPVDVAELLQLAAAAPGAAECVARADREDHHVRSLPAKLLARLEPERLASLLGVRVGADERHRKFWIGNSQAAPRPGGTIFQRSSIVGVATTIAP